MLNYLGHSVVDGVELNADQMIAQAGLDWDALTVDAFTAEGKAVPKLRAVVRSDNGEPIGHVGERYQTVQYREVAHTLEALGSMGSKFIQAGTLGGGARAFFVLTAPDGAGLDFMRDPHKSYLLATASHDGSGSVKIRPLMERIWCSNQISGLFWRRNTPDSVSVRHTKSAPDIAETRLKKMTDE